MRAVILQPMYLPWIGYFALIDISDVFVILDDVQFERRSWQHRNRIKSANGVIWLSVPVKRRFGQLINEALIDNSKNWRHKHWTTLKVCYSRAKFFNKYYDIFREIYEKEWVYLKDLNMELIYNICDIIGIDTDKFLFSSDLKVTARKTDRLIAILDKIGADEYITGPAAKAYIETNKFRERGIKLYWFNYEHPVYPQLYNNFIPYLSVVDLIFNVGPKALVYIRSGLKNALVEDA